jgi:hypothetical protein
MFDAALVKDLAEMMGKSLTFKDIEAVGGYLFKDHGFRTHDMAGVDKKISISPLNAARKLVEECERKGRLEGLFAFVFELDGVPLNGRSVRLDGLENVLYSLSPTTISAGGGSSTMKQTRRACRGGAPSETARSTPSRSPRWTSARTASW